MDRAYNPARSGSSTQPAELTLWVKRSGAADFVKFVASASSDVDDLKRDIKKELELAASIDSFSLQLQVDVGDDTAGSGKGNGGASQTMLVPLGSTDTIKDALTAALGRSITSKEKLRIVVSASRSRDELTFRVKRPGAADSAKFVVKAASDVADLKDGIKKKLEITVPIDNLSLLLQVADGDGTTGSNKSLGGAPKTKLVPLDSMATVSDALKAALGREATAHDDLTINVDVRSKPAGSIPYNSALGIDEAFWIDMSQDVQEHAVMVVNERQRLAAVPMLRDMRSKMTMEQATRNRVSVLDARDDDVKLGLFDVSGVASSFISCPKGACRRFASSLFLKHARKFRCLL